MFTVVTSLFLVYAAKTAKKIEDGDFDGLSYDGYTGAKTDDIDK